MQIFQSPTTPSKIFEPERDQITAQLGIVLINPTKFHQNPTKGCEEFVQTKFQWNISKSHNSVNYRISGNLCVRQISRFCLKSNFRESDFRDFEMPVFNLRVFLKQDMFISTPGNGLGDYFDVNTVIVIVVSLLLPLCPHNSGVLKSYKKQNVKG